MALLDIKLQSKVLGLNTTVSVLMPEECEDNSKLKVLWVLHGMTGNNNTWYRKSGIERYVQRKDICVIMPDANLSFYSDMKYGNDYFTYLTKELPQRMSSLLGISTKREDNYVMGNSMGGYGAFKLALGCPEIYSKSVSFSGALDIKMLYEHMDEMDDDVKKICSLSFGDYDEFKGSANDLRHLARLRKQKGNIPQMFMACGKNDFLFQNNIDFLEYLESIEVDVTHDWDNDYAHNWNYWDKKIERALEWMEL